MTDDLKNPLRVLVIENNDVDCRMIEGMLNQSPGKFQLSFAHTLTEASQKLQTNHTDCVLLDLNLPDCRGLETLVRLTTQFPGIAVVINTGAYEDDLGLKAVSHGAQDYLIKGKYQAYVLNKALYYAVERKRFEEELKGAYKSLKETQSQLIQMAKMNVVGGLASGVAHEVKNPLAAILYGVEFLLQKINSPDEKIAITLITIKESALKANNIVKDLLDFANSSKLDKRPENLNELLEKSIHLTKVVLDKHGIRISKEYGNIPQIDVDANRIEQVIVDLLLNAIYAMPNGGHLTVRTFVEKAVSPGKKFGATESIVVAELDDTGAGVPEEILDKVFDPFFTTRRASGGVGLGLAVAKNIIQSHGGEIFIFNRKEGGARVRLMFKE